MILLTKKAEEESKESLKKAESDISTKPVWKRLSPIRECCSNLKELREGKFL